MKASLLASTAVICFGLSNSSAVAACSNTAPANNETVTCAGNSTTAVNGLGKTGVTVNVIDNAHLSIVGSDAIVTGNQSHVSLTGNGIIQTTGDNAYGVAFFGTDSTITMTGTSSIATSGNASYGIDMKNAGGTVILNDNAHIENSGFDGHAIVSEGDNTTVTLNNNASIHGLYASVYGIAITANDSHVTMNDTSSISVIDFSNGISLKGNNNTATLNDHASIHTAGFDTNGIQLYNADHDTVTIGHDASITAGQYAIRAFDATNTTIINHGTLQGNVAGIVVEGAGSDNNTIFNDGTIIGGSGHAITFAAGNNSLTLGTGSNIVGTITGGTGIDHLTLVGSGSEDDQFINFEDMVMNGQSWTLSSNSTFSSIDIQNGLLSVNGTLTGTAAANVQQNGVLGGNGTLVADVTSTGTIAPGSDSGVVGTLVINHSLQQNNGAFDAEFDQHGIDRLTVTGPGGTAALLGNPVLNVIPVGGAAGANGIVLHADNGITGRFSQVNFIGNGAATLIQTFTDISLQSIDGTAVEGSEFASSQAGLDFLDTVDEETLADENCVENQTNHCKHLWAKGFGRFGAEAASDGNRSFDYRIAGAAMGGDMTVAKGLRLGTSLGYSNTDQTLVHDAANADINTTQVALYARYDIGHFFLTGQISGGWQAFDQSRNLAGNDSADSSTNAWLFGSSLQAGATFDFPNNWHLTPSAGVSYQHQWVDGYKEHGGGADNVGIESHQSQAVRLRAQVLLSQDYQLNTMTLTPHIKVGAMEQLNLGGHADGSFAADGTDFSLALNDSKRAIGLVGVGLQFGFANGLTTYVDYDGALSTDQTVHSVTGGLRYTW